jgi:Trp operon repressor
VQTLEEAAEQAVAQRVEVERKILESEYYQREVALLDTVTRLEASIAAAPPAKKK